MFYQESYDCTIYKKNPELVESVDFFIGSLVGDVANKITPALVLDKVGVQLEIAKQILAYYECNNVLRKMYAIVCPNEDCNQILKIVTSEDLLEELEDIKEITFCFNCEEEINDIPMENIFILYKRVKLYTVTQDEVNRTLQKNQIIEEFPMVNENFFANADSLDLDDLYSHYYSPNESAKTILRKEIEKITEDVVYNNTTDKGNALEHLCVKLLSEVKIFTVSKVYKTPTNQLDITVKPMIKFSIPSVLDDLVPYFICECKNEKEVPGNTYFHKLYSILETTCGKVGVLFSIEPCTKTCKKIAHDKYLLSNRRIKLINITKNDLKRVINNDVNILHLFKEKIDALTLESNSGLLEKGFE